MESQSLENKESKPVEFRELKSNESIDPRTLQYVEQTDEAYREKSEYKMYSYTECNDISDIQLQQSRGLLYRNNQLFSRSFPYTNEIVVNDSSSIPPGFYNDQLIFFKSLEGMVLRLFYGDSKWFLVTNRKFNACTSKWGSNQTFGHQFIESIESNYPSYQLFLDTLSKQCQYFFLLTFNKENRSVCKSRSLQQQVFHVATQFKRPNELDRTDLENGTFAHSFMDFQHSIGIQKPPLVWVRNEQHLVDQVLSLDTNLFQGLICIQYTNPDSITRNSNGDNTGWEYRMIKFVHPKYKENSLVRNNQPNLVLRYLEIRNQLELRAKFNSLFPWFSMQRIENDLKKIIHCIFHKYQQRYVRRRYIFVPPEVHYIMKQCYDWFLHPPCRSYRSGITDRESFYVTKNTISMFFYQSSAYTIYKLRRYYQRGQFNSWAMHKFN